MLVSRREIIELTTYQGRPLKEVSYNKKLLLVFLRHFGCSFCREALSEIQELDKKHSKNVEIILVHMATAEVAIPYFQKYNLHHMDHIPDPECKLYEEFGLLKANFNQLFGFRSWIRGLESGLIKGHGWGRQLGDGFQMPGIFTISKGKIISEYRHRYPSDKPDYEKLINCRIPKY